MRRAIPGVTALLALAGLAMSAQAAERASTTPVERPPTGVESPRPIHPPAPASQPDPQRGKGDPAPAPDAGTWLQVKFRDDSVVRLRGGVPKALGGRALSGAGARAVLAGAAGARWERLHAASEATLDGLRLRAGDAPDLNNWFALFVPADLSAESIRAGLASLAEVESASVAPEPVAPPAPDFSDPDNALCAMEARRERGDLPVDGRTFELPSDGTPRIDECTYQAYLDDVDAGGLGVRALWDRMSELGRLAGEGTHVCDVEYDADRGHEEIRRTRFVGLPDASSFQRAAFRRTDRDHGTAVLGIVGGAADGSGITGVAPGAELTLVPTLNTRWPGRMNVAAAVVDCIEETAPGDVILLEVQIAGPTRNADATGQAGLLPAEWDLAVFHAIQLATANGRIVVEAAGNGATDLARPELEDFDLCAGILGRDHCAPHAPFAVSDRAPRDASRAIFWNDPEPRFRSNDSGAILVGAGVNRMRTAGTTAAGERAGTNTGERVDVHAWGRDVLAPGYGDAGNDGRSPYTSFSGTSAAAALVAGGVAALQSLHLAETGDVLAPGAMRDLLRATGRPQRQRPDSARLEPIGPELDLPVAAETLLGTLRPDLAVLEPSPGDEDEIVVTVGAPLDPRAAEAMLFRDAEAGQVVVFDLAHRITGRRHLVATLTGPLGELGESRLSLDADVPGPRIGRQIVNVVDLAAPGGSRRVCTLTLAALAEDASGFWRPIEGAEIVYTVDGSQPTAAARREEGDTTIDASLAGGAESAPIPIGDLPLAEPVFIRAHTVVEGIFLGRQRLVRVDPESCL